ncbi:MAG: Holliday junction resolvase RuvX [Lysobacterales bacterium]
MPDQAVTPKTAPQSFLCFDYGLRKIGVATGQRITGTATPLEVVKRNDANSHWPRIEQLLAKWQPDALVVGIPLTVEGESQAMTRQARKFANQLSQRFHKPIFDADERYSSREAQERFKLQRSAGGARRSQAKREDAVAAQIILEAWFADNPH